VPPLSIPDVQTPDPSPPLAGAGADACPDCEDGAGSVAKLVTSIVALDMLGPQHRWHTEVLIDGSVSDHRLIGDLYIKGYGDPYLTVEAYAALIRSIRAKGIEQIAGNLVFDDSHLLPPETERGDFDGAAQRSYNALPAALSVNRQVTYLHIYNDRQHERVGVYTEPPLSALDIVNEARIRQSPLQRPFSPRLGHLHRARRRRH
jgi:D-alanyl-D-alanine carboxypeptidase/D-alanyl-D-alanine-endopeptidase (penicillin-binding protein 4)